MKQNYEAMKDILYYARKIIPVPSGEENNQMLAMTALKNLSDYGFTLDQQGIVALQTASKEDITNWYYDTSEKLNEMAGGNHKYHPFYPNFPEEVIEKTDFELFVDQISHYLSVAIGDLVGEDLTWVPREENEKEGKKSLEDHPLKVVATIRDNDTEAIATTAKEIFTNTLKSKLTPSVADTKNIINAYMQADPNWTKNANVVENRQVLSYLYTKAIMSNLDTSNMPSLVTNDYLKIAQTYSLMKENKTNVLEDVAAINEKTPDGKVKQQRVSSLPNAMRKFIATGLNEQKNLEEDVARNKQQWKAVFKIMHVGAIKDVDHLKSVAQKLRNNEPLNTFYSRIEKAFAEHRYQDALKMYASRPGEFVKNLNRLITVKVDDVEQARAYTTDLIDKTKEVFAKTRPEDLIRLVTYLNARTRENMLAIHNVKGTLVQTEKKHDTMPEKTAKLFISLAKEGIAEQIKTGVPYGKVYIDPQLAKAPLPTEISDTTEAMNAYPRGTRVPVEKDENGKDKNVRIFVWWTNQGDNKMDEFLKNHPGFAEEQRNNPYNDDWDWHQKYHDYPMHGNTRVDLDLSTNFFRNKEDGSGLTESAGSVSYHSSFRDSDNAVVHSGDMTDGGVYGGDGVCEYIDVNLEKLREQGKVDYIQVYVNSYTGQPFNEIPCLGGMQERSELDKSQQFDIKAVKQTSKLGNNERGVTMAILDVQAGEMIWVDSPERHAVTASNSILAASNFDTILERYARGDQMSMKEMAELAVKANGGEIVETIEEADVIFSLDAVQNATSEQRVITAKDQDIWLGEFMSPQTPNDEEPQKELEKEMVVEVKEEPKTIADLIASEISDAKYESVESQNSQNQGFDVELEEEREEEEEEIER